LNLENDIVSRKSHKFRKIAKDAVIFCKRVDKIETLKTAVNL